MEIIYYSSQQQGPPLRSLKITKTQEIFKLEILPLSDPEKPYTFHMSHVDAREMIKVLCSIYNIQTT